MTNTELIAAVKRQPLSFACGAVAALCFVGWYFRHPAVDDLGYKLEEVQSQMERVRGNIGNAVHLSENVSAATQAVTALEAGMIQPLDVGANQGIFYKLERETGVHLSSVQQTSVAAPPVKKNQPKPIYQPVPFSVTVSGSYAQLIDFLGRIERGPQPCHFISMTFNSRAGRVANEGDLTLSLSLEFLGKP